VKFFLRSPGDAMFAVNRCFFEADIGRANTAVQRLCDLAQEIPDDAHVLYAEGVIRRDYLGQGFTAIACFEKAYEVAVSTNPSGQTAWFAASNATSLAPNAEMYRHWAELDIRHCPVGHEDEIRHHREQITELDRGAKYLDLLLRDSQAADERNDPSCVAAILEVALKCEEMTRDWALKNRTVRATRLRALDSKDEKLRATRGEPFPPDERIALQEAIREIDAALEIDESDAPLWNYRAAWCGLLERHDEAIAAADRAIEIRPCQYARPHVNKAYSLYHLQRYQEALASIKTALEHAVSEGAEEQIAQARSLCQEYQNPPLAVTLEGQLPDIQQFLQLTQRTAREELEQVGQGWRMSPDAVTEMLVGQILRQDRIAAGQPAKACVPIMAQLLGDFTADTAFMVTCMVSARNSSVGDHCFAATLYLAAQSEGVQRRDATRLLALMILRLPDAKLMRQFYRQQILETAAAAEDEFRSIDLLLRDAVGRISPHLPRVLADQEAVTPAGCARAAHDIRVLFAGPPPEPIHSQARGPADVESGGSGSVGPGCAVCLTILIALFFVALYAVH
jgi:tetratricopeptide (TPR) repeat protein